MTRLLLTMAGQGSSNPARPPSLVPLLLVLWLLPFTLTVDAVLALWRRYRTRAVLSRPVVSCPRGHVVDLHGAWTCGACGLAYEGHGFSPCPFCQEVPFAVRCACGLPLVNPLAQGAVHGPL